MLLRLLKNAHVLLVVAKRALTVRLCLIFEDRGLVKSIVIDSVSHQLQVPYLLREKGYLMRVKILDSPLFLPSPILYFFVLGIPGGATDNCRGRATAVD